MKAVYEALYAIPELGAQPGDTILVEPAHPEAPDLVIREFGRSELRTIFAYLDELKLLDGEGVEEIEEQLPPRTRVALPGLIRPSVTLTAPALAPGRSFGAGRFAEPPVPRRNVLDNEYEW